MSNRSILGLCLFGLGLTCSSFLFAATSPQIATELVYFDDA
ncbi:MAG: hypothetical protein QNL51_17025 [Opitutaceae bacterium]